MNIPIASYCWSLSLVIKHWLSKHKESRTHRSQQDHLGASKLILGVLWPGLRTCFERGFQWVPWVHLSLRTEPSRTLPSHDWSAIRPLLSQTTSYLWIHNTCIIQNFTQFWLYLIHNLISTSLYFITSEAGSDQQLATATALPLATAKLEMFWAHRGRSLRQLRARNHQLLSSTKLHQMVLSKLRKHATVINPVDVEKSLCLSVSKYFLESMDVQRMIFQGNLSRIQKRHELLLPCAEGSAGISRSFGPSDLHMERTTWGTTWGTTVSCAWWAELLRASILSRRAATGHGRTFASHRVHDPLQPGHEPGKPLKLWKEKMFKHIILI